MVYSHLCWQCFEKTRKCQEHINTLRKKEKLIFLKPILDIKTKTCWSSWKGTKVLVPPAFLAGLSWKNMPTNDQIIAPSHWSKLLQWIWRSIFTGYILSKIFPAISQCAFPPLPPPPVMGALHHPFVKFSPAIHAPAPGLLILDSLWLPQTNGLPPLFQWHHLKLYTNTSLRNMDIG